MRTTSGIRKTISVRILQLLAAVALCTSDSGSTLFSQEPLEAPKLQIELKPLRAPKPYTEERDQEFEPVDPQSAAIPKSWFKDVPVTPIGLGLRNDDVPAYFRILEHLQHVPPENLKKADRRFRLEMIEKFGERTRKRIQRDVRDEAEQKRVLAQLEDKLNGYRKDPFSYELVRDAFNHAQTCQGQVVSFAGHARRPRSFPAGENEYGFDQLYEIWVFDEESNHYPVVIVCPELPDKLPVDIPDKEVIDGVSVRGYFFRLYAYEGKDKSHVVPMILAKTVEWNPPQTPARGFPRWVYALIVALGIVALWLIIRSNRAGKPLHAPPEPADNPFQ